MVPAPTHLSPAPTRKGKTALGNQGDAAHCAPKPILGTRRAQGSRDQGFGVPGEPAACWHAWIYRLPTHPSASQFLHTPVGWGELHHRDISSHSQGTGCSPGSALAPGGAGKAAKGAQRCRGHPWARQDAHAPARLWRGFTFPIHSARLRGSGELCEQEASGVISKEILKAKPLRAKEGAASNSIGTEQNKNHRQGRFNIGSNPIPDFLLLILQQPADGRGEGAALPPCSCPPHTPWCPPHIPRTRGGGGTGRGHSTVRLP